MIMKLLNMFLFCCIFMMPTDLWAEVRFGPYSWAAGQDTLVVISPDDTSPGVFVGQAPKDTRTQELSPNLFFSGKGASFFLKFDRARNSFSNLILSSGRSYPVGGGFAIKIGQVRIAVNPISENSRQAYWTISVGGNFIKGYVGLEEIYSLSGSNAVAYLEANQNYSAEASALHDYKLEQSGALMLDAKPFSGDIIGVLTPTRNICLEKALPIEMAEEKDNKLKQQKISSKNDWLVISVSSDTLQVYDLVQSQFGVVKTVLSAGKERCVFSAIEF